MPNDVLPVVEPCSAEHGRRSARRNALRFRAAARRAARLVGVAGAVPAAHGGLKRNRRFFSPPTGHFSLMTREAAYVSSVQALTDFRPVIRADRTSWAWSRQHARRKAGWSTRWQRCDGWPSARLARRFCGEISPEAPLCSDVASPSAIRIVQRVRNFRRDACHQAAGVYDTHLNICSDKAFVDAVGAVGDEGGVDLSRVTKH